MLYKTSTLSYLLTPRPPGSTLFPYTTLFRSASSTKRVPPSASPCTPTRRTNVNEFASLVSCWNEFVVAGSLDPPDLKELLVEGKGTPPAHGYRHARRRNRRPDSARHRPPHRQRL